MTASNPGQGLPPGGSQNRLAVRRACLVAAKDLRSEGGWRLVVVNLVPFAAVVMVLFTFALGAEPLLLTRAASGLLWTTVLMSSLLVVQRSFAAESAPGVADAMRLSSLRPAEIFFGKLLALLIQLLALSVVLHLLVAVWFQPGWKHPLLVLAAGVTTNLAISAASCLYGLLSASQSSGISVMPVLVLPALAPVLLAATQAYESAAGRGADGWPWVALMMVFAVSYCLLGAAVYGSLMEDA